MAMTELSCTYGDNRDESLVAYLYDDADGSPADRDRFRGRHGEAVGEPAREVIRTEPEQSVNDSSVGPWPAAPNEAGES